MKKIFICLLTFVILTGCATRQKIDPPKRVNLPAANLMLIENVDALGIFSEVAHLNNEAVDALNSNPGCLKSYANSLSWIYLAIERSNYLQVSMQDVGRGGPLLIEESDILWNNLNQLLAPTAVRN